MVKGGITRAVGGIKGIGFSHVVGLALYSGKLFWVEAVWRRVRTLDRDLWFLGSGFGGSGRDNSARGRNKRKRFFPCCRAFPGLGETFLGRSCVASRSDARPGCVVFGSDFCPFLPVGWFPLKSRTRVSGRSPSRHQRPLLASSQSLLGEAPQRINTPLFNNTPPFFAKYDCAALPAWLLYLFIYLFIAGNPSTLSSSTCPFHKLSPSNENFQNR